MTLPAAYVRAHTTLAYAVTVHAAQGQTVDTAHTIIAPRTRADAAYVALTRGRVRNTAYVPTDDQPDRRTPVGAGRGGRRGESFSCMATSSSPGSRTDRLTRHRSWPGWTSVRTWSTC